jgi:hypothetical protein
MTIVLMTVTVATVAVLPLVPWAMQCLMEWIKDGFQQIGPILGRVYNSRSGSFHVIHLFSHVTKRTNL